MMEFLIAIFPVMLIFFSLVQFSFAGVAKLVARHAAALGVRAAVVVLEEYTSSQAGASGNYSEPAGLLEVASEDGENDAYSEQNRPNVQNSLGSVDSSGGLSDSLQSIFSVLDRSSSRIDQIRTAVYIPFLTISPNVLSEVEGLDFLAGGITGDDSVRSAIGSADFSRLAGAFLYNLGAVAVTFPDPEEPSEYKEYYKTGENVTVRVSYLFRCRVPVASWLLCDSGWALYSGKTEVDWATYWTAQQIMRQRPKSVDEIETWSRALDTLQETIETRQARIDRFHGHKADFDRVESSTIQKLLLIQPGARYMMLQAEATLPLQSARYYPRYEEE